jgi:hypothetical protein
MTAGSPPWWVSVVVLATVSGAALGVAATTPSPGPVDAPPAQVAQATSSVGATGCPGSRVGSTGGPVGGRWQTDGGDGAER